MAVETMGGRSAMAEWTPLLVEERIVEAAYVLRRLPEEKVRG